MPVFSRSCPYPSLPKASRGVVVGAGILPGVSIGDDVLIGAGSVVTGDELAGATAFGNPTPVQTATSC